MSKIALDTPQAFHERPDWFEDTELVRSAAACIDAQRQAASEARARFVPNPEADLAVSPEALDELRRAGEDVHGISSDHRISNVISFNAAHLEGAVNSSRVAELRSKIDAMVIRKLRDTFERGEKLTVSCSGHFWYPPGAYMGWHTNSGATGWRIYLTHSAEPGKSFFRYRDPRSGNIVTSLDHAWDVRLFRIDAEAPLWHAVYSQTDRFSLGYVVYTQRPLRAIAGKLKQMLAR